MCASHLSNNAKRVDETMKHKVRETMDELHRAGARRGLGAREICEPVHKVKAHLQLRMDACTSARCFENRRDAAR